MGRLRRGVRRPVESKHEYCQGLGREAPKALPIDEPAGGNHMADAARMGGAGASEETAALPGAALAACRVTSEQLWVTVPCTVLYRWLGRDLVRLALTEP